MFGIRKTLGSLLLVVAFLALASLATFFYNTDQERKDEITKSELVQKSEETLGALLGASGSMTEVNVQKNIGLGKTMADFIGGIDWRGLLTGTSTETVSVETLSSDENESDALKNADATSSSWSKFSKQIKDEWQRGRGNDNQLLETEVNEFGKGIFVYQKNDSGAEIIINSKSGVEYKLPLPFRFLSR